VRLAGRDAAHIARTPSRLSVIAKNGAEEDEFLTDIGNCRVVGGDMERLSAAMFTPRPRDSNSVTVMPHRVGICAGICAAALAAPIDASAQGVVTPPFRARLHYRTTEAARSCEDRAAFSQVVAARFGYTPFDATANTLIDIEIGRTGQRLVASLVINSRIDDTSEHRIIHSSDRCLDLWGELAREIYITYGIPPPPTPSRPPPPEPPPRWLFGATLSSEVYGHPAAFAPGLRLHAGRRWGNFSLRGELRAQWPRSHEAPGLTLQTALMGGGLVGCWHPGRFAVCGAAMGLWLWQSNVDFFDFGVGAFLGPRLSVVLLRWGSGALNVDLEGLVLAGRGNWRHDGQVVWRHIGVASLGVRIEWSPL